METNNVTSVFCLSDKHMLKSAGVLSVSHINISHGFIHVSLGIHILCNCNT